MGGFADDVQKCLREALSENRPEYDWQTEYAVGATPVDIGGTGQSPLVLIELEWRRADPSDNAAKLFRHLSEDMLPAERVVVAQLFTNYYDLKHGGVSSKRKNAEFVGAAAARTLEGVTYHPIDFDIDPPKRGGVRPSGWERSVETVADIITEIFE
jgi:hypothetical protein